MTCLPLLILLGTGGCSIVFASSVLQAANKAPSWPSLFRLRAAAAPVKRPISACAASVVLKPVLATPRRDECDLAV